MWTPTADPGPVCKLPFRDRVICRGDDLIDSSFCFEGCAVPFNPRISMAMHHLGTFCEHTYKVVFVNIRMNLT